MSDEFWAQNFNTQLSPVQEAAFNSWVKIQSQKEGRDLSLDLLDYDLRGYWKERDRAAGVGGHLSDKYKKPNHPTFSDESIYHGVPDPKGGRFAGGVWSGNDATGWEFRPSHHMLSNTHNLEYLKRYMAENERGVRLVLPVPYKQ